MHRPRYLRCLLLAPVLIGLVLAAAGCGGSEHDLMIKKFFMASSARVTRSRSGTSRPSRSIPPVTAGRRT